METVGLTGKLCPLAEVPIKVPPEAEVYHLIIPPAKTALKLALTPQVIGDWETVRFVGTEGLATTTVTEDLEEVPHAETVSA